MATLLHIALKNNTSSSNVYAHITGRSINHGNDLFFLLSDGKTPYYPPSPPSNGNPLQANCAIPLGPPGSTRNVVIPQIAGGRIWLSVGKPIVFLLNIGPALVEPDVTNPSDPNSQTRWDFCEFTFNNDGLYANITYVNFVSLPTSMTLTSATGPTQYFPGIPPNGIDTLCTELIAQHAADGADWDQLIVLSGGQNLRVLSPDMSISRNPSLFSGYFDSYVNQVWSKYTSSPLYIDTQIAGWGIIRGQVLNGVLAFENVVSFAKPTARDIFSCTTGVFDVPTDKMKNIAARLAAGFNRSILLPFPIQPGGTPADYYKTPITNHYSRLLHKISINGLGYGFPYDDVKPNGGTDQSGALIDRNPLLWTVAVSDEKAGKHGLSQRLSRL